MTKNEALKIINHFNRQDNPSKNNEFIYIEALNFLIETENHDGYMIELGGYYYGLGKFNLAEKYYLMAFNNGNKWATNGLGFIYFYGRTGDRDYKKAFYYFSIAKQNGNLEAAMKIADMYRDGLGVNQDLVKYKKILEDLYSKLKNAQSLGEPLPEVSHRLADLYIKENRNNEALSMLLKGKEFIVQRIRYNPFWGNFIVCRRTIELLYKVKEFDIYHFDFFDLFYYLKTPHKVKLIFNGKVYKISSFFEDDQLRVKCDEKYFKSIEDFLIKALFDNKHTYVIHYDYYYKLESIA